MFKTDSRAIQILDHPQIYATTNVEYREEKGEWQWGEGQDTGLKDTLPVIYFLLQVDPSPQVSKPADIKHSVYKPLGSE